MLKSEFSEIFKVNKVNFFQKQLTKMNGTIRVPAFEFNFNLVVCPLQGTLHDVSLFEMTDILITYFYYYRMKVSSMC